MPSAILIAEKTEIVKQEQLLYECALAVEKDETLKADMALWDAAISDGLKDR